MSPAIEGLSMHGLEALARLVDADGRDESVLPCDPESVAGFRELERAGLALERDGLYEISASGRAAW